MYVASMPAEFLMKREEFRESLKGLLTIFKIFLEVMPKTCEYLLPNLLVVEHIITGKGPLFEGFKSAVVDEEIITLLADLKENREQAEEKNPSTEDLRKRRSRSGSHHTTRELQRNSHIPHK